MIIIHCPLAFANPRLISLDMKSITYFAWAIATATALCTPVWSQDASVLDRWADDPTQVFDSAEVDLAALQWSLRPLVVFADTPNDPRFRQQFDLLMEDIDSLIERDVIIITDTDPEAMTDVRQTLRPRGYMMALLAKDGRVALRKPTPWSVRELSRSIDKMPLRQQEITDRRDVTE